MSGASTYRVTRLLAIDLGTRRIGVALGDPATGRVRALTTLTHRDAARDAQTIARIAGEQDATRLVVGLPLSLDGTEGPQATATRAWGAEVAMLTGLPVDWQDERYTSVAAERRIGGPGRGRSGGAPSPGTIRAHRARIDRDAAVAIAQAALDARTARTGA